MHGAVVDDEDEDRRRAGDRLLVGCASVTLLLAAGWALQPWLTYVRSGGSSLALVDPGGSLPAVRDVLVAPRLLGALLVALGAATALLAPRQRAGVWCATAGPLLGLVVVSAHWAGNTAYELPRSALAAGWYLDVVLALASLTVLLAGGVAVVRTTGLERWAQAPRPASLPYVVTGVAVVAVVAVVLMSRNRLFVPSAVFGSTLLAPEVLPMRHRLTGLFAAVAMVVMPLLATLAPTGRLVVGLTVGWIDLVAVCAVQVLVGRSLLPGGLGTTFVLGVALVVVTAAGLMAWAVRADRRPVFVPAATRRPRAGARP